MTRALPLARSSRVAVVGIAALLSCTSGDDVYVESHSNSALSASFCCTDFKVGADLSTADFGVDASIKGQFGVVAQAGSDFAATTTALLEEVTNACRRIAVDLGAASADQQAAETEKNGPARVRAWCKLAVAQLATAGASSGTLDIEPPRFRCDTSIDAKTSCQARCGGDATCDAKTAPPTCTGGTLIVECGGSCRASVAGAAFACKGRCDAAASGTCTAQGGVECQGRCEGTCVGTTDASGDCKGQCKGSCSSIAPSKACGGAFDGMCMGTCAPSGPSASVQCSGTCTVPARPLKCEGGTLGGGCTVDAKCNASCDASAQAKASCSVEPFRITANGTADANLEAAIATLRTNLPALILAVKARGEAFVRVVESLVGASTVTLVSDPGKLGVRGTACMIAIGGALGAGAENAKASIDAGLTVTGQIGVQ